MVPHEQAAPPARASWTAARLSLAPGPLLLVVVALCYLGVAQVTMLVNDPVNTGASLWPAAGLTLAALMLVPTRRWGWVLGAVLLAETGGDLALGYPLPATAWWVAANTLGPLVGAALLRRSGNRQGALAPVTPLLLFLAFGVVVGPLVSSTIGSMAFTVLGESFTQVWPRYLVGDSLGVLVAAPALLATRRGGPPRSLRERLGLVVGSTVTAVVVFSDVGGSWTLTMPYLVIPFFAWAALRFGTYGTALLGLLVTGVADTFTAYGQGPFAMTAPTEAMAVTLLQVFLASTITSALLLAAVAGDLRDRRHTERLLRHQAMHDPLTGLANRMLLAEELDAACSLEAGERSKVGLLVCDLDDFKAVNDRFGHRGGDELLVEVAARLVAGVRAEDVVARISGDEFVVLLRGVGEESLLDVARRISRSVHRPTVVAGRGAVQPSMSVGGALLGAADTAETFFRMADTAVYEAKRRGRGRIVLADEELRRRADTELRTEERLAVAFERGELVAHYEPVVRLATGRVVGVEATLRWRHPELGLLAAERYVAAVEATGLADRLLETTLTQAAAAQAEWFARCGRRVPVSVNVSGGQLAAGGVVNVVLRLLTDLDLAPGSLVVEVTKRAPLGEMALASLHQLHALGVRLVLDGFGAGWASMEHLARIPWDHLKVDRSFVAGLGQEPGAAEVVEATVAMARALDLEVAADGVTRMSQLETLAGLGCGMAQGSLFGRPVTAGEMADLLAADRRWPTPVTAGGPASAPSEV